MSENLVSVIIPCYNQGRFLSEAIDSALAQTYRHSEIIVVNDGSTDDTVRVAGKYPEVRLISQNHRGPSIARNTGLSASSGDFVVFLDADDRLLPQALEAGLVCLEQNPECGFVYGLYRLIESDGSPISAQIRPAVGRDYLDLLRFNYIGMLATVMYRRAVFEFAKGFDTSLAGCEDYDLFLRISRLHPIRCHGRVVAEYRQHSANASSNPELMLETSLRVLKYQWKYVRGNSAARDACIEGMRNWRDYYGTKLLRTMSRRIRNRDWKRVIRGGFALLRYYPKGATKSVVRKAWSMAALAPRHFTIKASR